MNDGYIFAYMDAQKITYPQLRFIQQSSNKLFGIFQPYGDTNYVELELARVILNDAGVALSEEGRLVRAQGGVVDIWNDVVRFHQKFGVDYDGPPRLLEKSLDEFRTKFVDEEHKEFKTAEDDNKRIDAIADLIYVALGYSRLRGWNFPEAWRRVHAKNMLKRNATPDEVKAGKARHITDIVKPDGWTPPDHSDLVAIINVTSEVTLGAQVINPNAKAKVTT